MDARKILVKRLGVSLVVGLLLTICLCAALDKGDFTNAAANPAQAAGDLPIIESIIWNLQVVPIRDEDLCFHVAWEASIPFGDNDRDGSVSIADITPIGMRFGEDVGDDLYLTMLDDNRNGVIDGDDIDDIRRYYGIRVPWFWLELRNYETGVWRLVQLTNWSSHQISVTERCAFEADIQAEPGEETLRVQPIFTPASAPYGGRSISLLPYLQPSSQ